MSKDVDDSNLPQIEKATIMELDWALAHLNSKSKKPAKAKAEDWVYEADMKGGKEEVSRLSPCFTLSNHGAGRFARVERSSVR
jgi:hypothetical protein